MGGIFQGIKIRKNVIKDEIFCGIFVSNEKSFF
jgi:hypothetical protein